MRQPTFLPDQNSRFSYPEHLTLAKILHFPPLFGVFVSADNNPDAICLLKTVSQALEHWSYSGITRYVSLASHAQPWIRMYNTKKSILNYHFQDGFFIFERSGSFPFPERYLKKGQARNNRHSFSWGKLISRPNLCLDCKQPVK